MYFRNTSMKFNQGQKVIVLTTERKPAGYGFVINYNVQINKYKVSYTYPNTKEAEEIELPEDRIVANDNPVFSVS